MTAGDSGAGHDVYGLRHHDALCPPGMKAGDELCPWCVLIRKARTDERRKILAVADALRHVLDMPCDTTSSDLP